MSEKLFTLLLRLYPSSFRARYGLESMQLFRDRAQQEQGLYLQLRLWADILADFAVSLPHEYRKAQPTLLAASAGQSSDGTPSFYLLENKPLRPEALASGALLSLVVLGASCLLILHAGDDLPSASRAQHPLSATPSSEERERPAEKATANTREAPSTPRQTAKTPVASTSVDPHSAYVPPNAPKRLDRAALLQPQASMQKAQASAAVVSVPQTEAKLDSAERQLVIEAAIRNLKEYYFDPKIAEKTANALRVHEQRGEDSAAADGPAFAELLTRQMRDASQDMHLSIEYSRDRLPDHPQQPTAGDLARSQKMLEQNNCFIEQARKLPHNIGYLKLDWFSDPTVCQQKAAAAMASLNNANAIIFDLRSNRGGDPGMVLFLGSYLFDQRVYWYNPRGSTPEQSRTHSPVPGSKLANKPVYILTSASTWSGAEQFSYDLKMLERATLVGETTRGGAHAGVFHRIDDHFGIGIPEVEVINPYSNADWEGVGVEPNVKVKAADALKTAEKLAETELSKK